METMLIIAAIFGATALLTAALKEVATRLKQLPVEQTRYGICQICGRPIWHNGHGWGTITPLQSVDHQHNPVNRIQ